MKFLQIYTLAALLVLALTGCTSGRESYGGNEWANVQDDPYAVPSADAPASLPNEWAHQPVQWSQPTEDPSH